MWEGVFLLPHLQIDFYLFYSVFFRSVLCLIERQCLSRRLFGIEEFILELPDQLEYHR